MKASQNIPLPLNLGDIVLSGELSRRLIEQLGGEEALQIILSLTITEQDGEESISFSPELPLSTVNVVARTLEAIVEDNLNGSLMITAPPSSPKFGERLLLLVLRTKDERVNIPGDLEEEFKEIAAKHGARYAKLWYYKQVAASAWPMVRKAVGWGLLASLGAWIRRII